MFGGSSVSFVMVEISENWVQNWSVVLTFCTWIMNEKSKDYWDYPSFFVFPSFLPLCVCRAAGPGWVHGCAGSAGNFIRANGDWSYAQERLSALILLSGFN